MSAQFELKGTGQGAVDLVRQLNKAVDETEKKGKLTAKQLEKMKLAAEAFAAQGDKLEQYNLKIKKLGEFVKKGALEQEHAEKTANRWRQRLDEVGKSGERAFGSQALANLKSYVTGMIGITGMVAALRAEITAMRAEADRTSQAKLTAADARRVLRTQIALATPAEQKQVLDAANRLGADPSLGVPQNIVDLTLNSAVSASPDIGRAVSFTEFGLRLTKGTGDTTTEIGGALDVANALNTDNPQAAFAFLNAAKQVSRGETTAKIAKNLPRVVNAAVIAGADPRLGGSILAGLSVGGADPDLEITRTASINLIDRLNKFFTQNKFKDIPLDQRDEFAEQFELAFNNDALGQQFMKSPQFQFRAPARSAMQTLFTPGTKAREAALKFYQVIGDDPAATGRGMIEYINSGRYESQAQTERVISKASESRRLAAGDVLSQERVTDLVQDLTMANRRANMRLFSLLELDQYESMTRMNLTARFGPTIDREEAIEAYESGARRLRTRHGNEAAMSRARQEAATLEDIANSLRNIDRKSNASSSQQE